MIEGDAEGVAFRPCPAARSSRSLEDKDGQSLIQQGSSRGKTSRAGSHHHDIRVAGSAKDA